MLINDQLRVLDQSERIMDELRRSNIDPILDLARWGIESGVLAVDILIFHPDLDEIDLLPRIAHGITSELGCPVSLDSRSPEALEAALEAITPCKAMINSVTAEDDILAKILPIAKRFNTVIVGMPIGREPESSQTADSRIDQARIILDACIGIGIPHDDVVIDGVCMASSVVPGSFETTRQTLERLHSELHVATILGIGNAGFGMPDMTVIDLAYLIAAIPSGLDAALVNPATRGLVETVRAIDFLSGRDPYGKRYLNHYRSKLKHP